MVCRRGNVPRQLTPTTGNFRRQEVKGKRPHLWNSSLEQVVFHREGGGVHRGDDQHGNIWMPRRTGGKVERDVNPAAVKHSDGFEVT